MNERIKEIKESSRPEIDWEARHYVELNNGEKERWQNEWFDKFAELIVLECVNTVMDGTKEGDHYAMRIEQHFDNGPGGILHFGVE